MHVPGIMAIKHTKSIFAPLLKKGRKGKRRVLVLDLEAARVARRVDPLRADDPLTFQHTPQVLEGADGT